MSERPICGSCPSCLDATRALLRSGAGGSGPLGTWHRVVGRDGERAEPVFVPEPPVADERARGAVSPP